MKKSFKRLKHKYLDKQPPLINLIPLIQQK